MRALSILGPCLLAASCLFAHSTASGEDVNPCGGAHFVEHLGNISFATTALHLLNGAENPKLKRLFEWRLKTAAEDAKQQLDRGVTVEAVGLPNWASGPNGLREARAYATSHSLPATVIENLTALEEWVSKQPSGLSAPPR